MNRQIERKKLLDRLLADVETLQRLNSTDEVIRGEIKFLAHRVEDTVREERFQREARKRHRLRRVEIIERQRKPAKQASLIQEQISQTKKRLLR